LKVENLDGELKSKNEEIQKMTMNRMPLEEKCKVIKTEIYILLNRKNIIFKFYNFLLFLGS